MKIQNTLEKLTAYYTPTGFYVEYENDSNIEGSREKNSLVQDWKNKFEQDKYKALLYMGFLTKQEWSSDSLYYLYQIADALLYRLSKLSDIELLREETVVELTEEEITSHKDRIPYSIGMEYVDDHWICDLWENLLLVFRQEIKSYQGTVAMFFTEHNAKINIAGRVFFHLVESKQQDYPFAFMATYSVKQPKSKKALHTPLKNALVEFKQDEKQLLSLLSTVTKVAEESMFISNLMESGELFSPLKFTSEEAYQFFREIPIYEAAGILCRVPDWWRKKNNSINLKVTIGEKSPSKVGLDALMEFSPSLTMDGEPLSKKELKDFLAMAEGLVQYKGKWVEINKEKLKAVLAAFDKVEELSKQQGITLSEAMKLELNPERITGELSETIDIGISNGRWLKDMKEKLISPEKIHEISLEPTLHATLRTYQESGYQWLYTMSKMGLGACLADDMGLGKTLQVIAFLEHARVNYGGHALLIIPASLIGNWQKEIEKFAPQLTFQILHNSILKVKETWKPEEDTFLYITTYKMAISIDSIHSFLWDYVILDEAQAIKNAGTKQSKGIKEIPSRMRIAMTGTPIENRLGDLWSLFDFLNRGLLGTSKEFSDFTKGISENPEGYGKLRKMVTPFILRRLKTDKSIIADLPDKIEMKEYTTMSKKQVGLYQKLVEELGHALKEAEGISRKGLVLSSIIKLKQICNHPDQFLGLEDYKPVHSGKFEQLTEICETIRDKRERVLVFTQFKEMTEPLAEYLSEVFGKKGFVLHGGTSVKERSRMVDLFNQEEYIPYMVLSLRAGGVGLNLTSANHVIHFDRWWNPAVENQATDRVFRIGQSKNVLVHKFITRGTIEEKIDAMIEEKQKLAGDLLAVTGENWITELNNDELMQLLTLGGGL